SLMRPLAGPRNPGKDPQSLTLVVAVDELDRSVDVLLRHRTTDSDRGQVSLPWENHILEHPRLTPKPMCLRVRTVERTIDRDDRDRKLREVDGSRGEGTGGEVLCSGTRGAGRTAV